MTTTAAETTTTTAPTTTAPAETSTTVATTDTTAEPTTTEGTESTTSSTTQPSTGTPTTIDEAGRERVRAAETAKAREVDAANAKLSELTNALAVLQSDVNTQAAEVEIATRRFTAAQAVADAAAADITELETRVRELEVGLSDQAIRSFKGGVVEEDVLSIGRNPNTALRMQAMLAKATQSDIDYVNELASVREDLIARRADTAEAAAAAEEARLESEEQLAALELDQDAQAELIDKADDRLDHLLSERRALAQLGDGLGTDVNSEEAAALVAQLASAPPPAPRTSSGSSAPPPVSQSEIEIAAKGIAVHVSIVDEIRRLLADADAAGIDLAGGGYRDPQGQINARRANCGTSDYAIYEMRSSQCRPPTARPGRSQHEQGLAIDFTYNGALIRSRSGPGWTWLKNNAANYGLFNLPSEPWHWSVNGR